MDNINDEELKLDDAFRRYPVLVHKNFTLFHAGDRGDDFFDVDNLTCNPESQTILITLLKDRIDKLVENGMQFNKIAFIDKESGPTGLLPLASSISQLFNIEIVILRPWKKLRFDHIKVKGFIENNDDYPLKPDDSILLIDDVITTGGTQERAINLVESFGAKIIGIVCALVRNTTNFEKLQAKKKINFASTLRTYDQLIFSGHSFPKASSLLSDDFFQKIKDEVIAQRVEYGYSPEKAKIAEKALDEVNMALEDIFSEIAKEKGLSFDDDVKKSLKNLYIAGLMGVAQSPGK